MKRSRSPRYSDRWDHEDDEAAPSSSSPPPVTEDGFQYDVFLSFRGPDTRNGFTGHLYHALQDKGIHTFIDSEELEKGQKVEELFGYIERSKIFMPVFSQGYADSEWCLKEITKIVECKRLIIPVFFDVEPRDVRGQSGPFEPAFTRYGENDITNKEEVRKWRNALIEAGKVSGYNSLSLWLLNSVKDSLSLSLSLSVRSPSPSQLRESASTSFIIASTSATSIDLTSFIIASTSALSLSLSAHPSAAAQFRHSLARQTDHCTPFRCNLLIQVEPSPTPRQSPSLTAEE